MGWSFHDALRDARLSSRYPRMCDFTRIAGVREHTYAQCESGRRFLTVLHLEQTIHRCGISETVANNLRQLHAIEVAKRLGITIRQLPPNLNVSELAAKIQREVEYELKRSRLTITTRTRQVCTRRIEMLLKDSLEIP